MSASSMRTPTGKVRGLGSAKSGTEHHIRQRVTALGLVFLVPWFIYGIITATKGGYEGALEWVAAPWNAILLVLTFGVAFYHMRLGMQVIIEDYIQKTGTKQALLILNAFACVVLFVAAALSVLKIWIAAA